MVATNEATICIGLAVEGDDEEGDGPLDEKPFVVWEEKEVGDVGEDGNNEDVYLKDTVRVREGTDIGSGFLNTVQGLRQGRCPDVL